MPTATIAPPDAFEATEQGTGSYIYYRRPDGSIGWGAVGDNQFEKFKRMAERWEPLEQYGYFQWDDYACTHPYEALLVRGGAAEFAVKQLVELGYHHRPPLVPGCRLTHGEAGHAGIAKRIAHHPRCWQSARPAAFPQLAGQALPPGAECSFCDDGLVYATAKARDQHVKVMHQEEMRQARMGQELGAVLAQKLGQMGMQMPAFACNLCPETFADVTALAEHVNAHQEVADPPRTRGKQAAVAS